MYGEPRHSPELRGRMLDLRSGGWTLLLAAALIAAVVVWRLSAILPTLGSRLGSGALDDPTNGFDLTTCLVSREQLVAASGRDFLPALINPPAVLASQLVDGQRLGRVRRLLGSERVIGVLVEGQARAYPLWIMAWHEVVNDTLAGQPILVTYNLLCDSAVAFDRRVDGQALEFGVSGLLYNSNLLFYDRQPGRGDASLWCQLQFRAVAGPAAAAGKRLRILPTALVTWKQWRASHPDTSVLLPDASRARRYKRDDYLMYYGSDELKYPVSPLPADATPYKTPVVAVRIGQAWRAFSVPGIIARAGGSGRWSTQWEGQTLHFDCRADPPSVAVYAGSWTQPAEAVYSLWFAWYAMYPQTERFWP